MKLRPFQIPDKIKTVEADDKYARFVLSPIERSFGTTLGNAFRRTLLSSMQGSTVSFVRIDGILHEFSTIDGVLEDLPHILLNFKGIKIKLFDKFEKEIELSIKGKGPVYAKNIESDGTFEIINPEHLIATVMKDDVNLNVILGVTTGRGYVPREELPGYNRAPIGTIFIDALYSPIERVNFKVESVGVKNREKLILEIWTDGRIKPEDAVTIAAALLRDHIEPFLKLREITIEREREEPEDKKRLKKTLNIKISELELSVRAANCLKTAGIETLRDLVQMTEQEMLKFPNFGKKSLQELSTILKSYSLSFGMEPSKLEGK